MGQDDDKEEYLIKSIEEIDMIEFLPIIVEHLTKEEHYYNRGTTELINLQSGETCA